MAVDLYDMPLKAKPFGYLERFDWGADIHSLSWDGRCLVVRVLRNRNQDEGIEVTFSTADGFRYLDEVPLAEYWMDENFPAGFPVLEVLDGGWGREEERRLGYSTEQREWIIVTAGSCVSVFSPVEPEICDGSWPEKQPSAASGELPH